MLESTSIAPRSSWSAVRSALVAEVLRRSGRVRVRGQIHGESMLPALWPGDVVEIENCSLEDVRPGEIVLALREDRLVLHRLVALCGPDGFQLRGDSAPDPDPLLPAEALLGRLVSRVQCPAPEGASDSDEVAVSLERYPDTKRDAPTNRSPVRKRDADSIRSPDTKRYPDMKRGFVAAGRAALRFDLHAKCSRALGMVFCHCAAARRLALKLHSHRRPSVREFPPTKDGGDVGAL